MLIRLSVEFMDFEQRFENYIQDTTKQLSRKSNIKDVCALLDMKASKFRFASVDC